jgi:D-alanyl-D-alanine carboxypeptidase
VTTLNLRGKGAAALSLLRPRPRSPAVLAVALCSLAVLGGCAAPAADTRTHPALGGPLTESPSAAPPGEPAALLRAPLQREPHPAPDGSKARDAVAPKRAAAGKTVLRQGAARDAYSDPSRFTVVVNKRRPLVPLDYAPAALVVPRVPLAAAGHQAQLAPEAARAAEQMFAAAAAEGIGLVLLSGYRSYEEQHATYQHWLRQHSGDSTTTDTVSAQPGYSEHQTGFAFDVGQADAACTLQPCFQDTAAGMWARDNAHRFGLILRYPEGMHEVTGFHSESWHYRYIGKEAASAMKRSETLTLEEHCGLRPAPSYR